MSGTNTLGDLRVGTAATNKSLFILQSNVLKYIQFKR